MTRKKNCFGQVAGGLVIIQVFFIILDDNNNSNLSIIILTCQIFNFGTVAVIQKVITIWAFKVGFLRSITLVQGGLGIKIGILFKNLNLIIFTPISHHNSSFYHFSNSV